MADTEKSEKGDSAEKAYAAAAQSIELKPAVETPVEFPSKSKRDRKPQPNSAKPAIDVPLAEALPVMPPLPVTAAPVAAKPALLRKPAVAKAKPVVKAAAPKPIKPLAAPAFPNSKSMITKEPAISQLKDKKMATQTTDFTSSAGAGRDTIGGLKDVFTDVKTKAKAAFDKGTSSIGDATEFAKGNVEAVVESGKIYAAGLQELGSSYVTEGKTAFETLTADVKELAAQKTPTDFFKLQGDIARKNFENAVAFGSKSSEAWLKLAGDAFAPLSSRVSLAVEKIKVAA